MSYGKSLFLWLGFMLAALVLVGCGEAPTSGPSGVERLEKRLARQFEAAGDEIVPCTAVQLYQDYDANEVAADGKYKDKWISLEGRVASVAKDVTGDPYVAFVADGYGVAQVHAQLFDVQVTAIRGPKDFDICSATEKAAVLTKGQSVTVECLAQGAVLGIPRLEQCLVVSGLQ